MRTFALVWLLALHAHAQETEWVIPPGRESAIGDVLGLSEASVGSCEPIGAHIESTRVIARYRCEREIDVVLVRSNEGTFAIEDDIPVELRSALRARIDAYDGELWVRAWQAERRFVARPITDPRPRTSIPSDALALYDAGRFDEAAARFYELGIESWALAAWVRSRMVGIDDPLFTGIAHLAEGALDAAVADLEQAHGARALAFLAMAELERGNVHRADEHINAALRMQPLPELWFYSAAIERREAPHRAASHLAFYVHDAEAIRAQRGLAPDDDIAEARRLLESMSHAPAPPPSAFAHLPGAARQHFALGVVACAALALLVYAVRRRFK